MTNFYFKPPAMQAAAQESNHIRKLNHQGHEGAPKPFVNLGVLGDYSCVSLSSAVSVSSSTSHDFRILKIDFEAKPARVSWRKMRAVCFWSAGFLRRLRRR